MKPEQVSTYSELGFNLQLTKYPIDVMPREKTDILSLPNKINHLQLTQNGWIGQVSSVAYVHTDFVARPISLRSELHCELPPISQGPAFITERDEKNTKRRVWLEIRERGGLPELLERLTQVNSIVAKYV